jgi:hypothetical protein
VIRYFFVRVAQITRATARLSLCALSLLGILPPLAAMANGSSGMQAITGLSVGSTSQLVWISGPAAWSNPDNSGTSNIVVLQLTNIYSRELLVEATAGSIGGKSIAFWLTGCTNPPWGNVPVVTSVTLY